MTDRTTKAFHGTLTSYLQYGVVILLQIFLAPLVLKHAGQDTLGIYSIIMQIIGYLALLDLGFGVAINRFLPQAFGKEDGFDLFSKIFNSARTFTLFSNLIVSILIFTLNFFVNDLFQLSAEITNQVNFALIILAIWTIIRTPLQIFGNALIAIQELARSNIISMAGHILRLILSILFIYLGLNVIGLILAGIVSEFGILFSQKLLFQKKIRLKNIQWRIVDKKLFRELFSFGLQGLLLNISLRLVFYTDNIVVGYLFGAAVASIYYTTQMPVQIFQQIIMRLADNSTPAINELFSRNNFTSLSETYLRLQKYTLILVLPSLIIIYFLGEQIISIWVGKQQFAGYSMLLALTLFTFTLTIAHSSNPFIMAHGKIKLFSIITFIEGIVNIFLSLYLGKLWGLEGVIWATFFANLPTFLYVQNYAINILQIKPTLYFNSVIKPIILPCLYLIVLSFFFNNINFENIIGVIVKALIIILPYFIIVFTFSLNIQEKIRIKLLLKLS